MDYFGPKNGASSELWVHCKNFFKFYTTKKGQEVDESNNNGLYQKKICSGQMGHFGPENDTSS